MYRAADKQLSPILQESDSYNTQNSSKRVAKNNLDEIKQEESKSSRLTSQEFRSLSSGSSSRISGLARPLRVEVEHLTSPTDRKPQLEVT